MLAVVLVLNMRNDWLCLAKQTQVPFKSDHQQQQQQQQQHRHHHQLHHRHQLRVPPVQNHYQMSRQKLLQAIHCRKQR